jgi:peroxiredoxin
MEILKRHWKPALLGAAVCAALGALAMIPVSAKAVKGEPAPDFSGTALDGRKVALSQFKGKNPVLLSFYADFCPPCRKDFEHLKGLDARLGPKGLRIVGVSMDDDRNTALNIPKATGVRFPVVFDPGSGIGKKYGVQALPHTVVIDRDGKVQAEVIGLEPDKVDRALEQVLK